MNIFRREMHRNSLRKYFSQQIGKKAAETPVRINRSTYTTLGRILKNQKWGLVKVIMLTGIHGIMFLGLPLVLQELAKLSSLRVGQPVNKDAEVQETKQENKSSEQPSMADMAKGSFKLDYDKLREKLTGEVRDNSTILTEDQIRARYFEYKFVIGIFFGTLGIIGYFKHMKSKRLEDFYAIMIKRKLYRELMVKNYSRFLSKDLNPTMITQKINANVNSFSSGLVDNINGVFRASLLFVGGSAAMLAMIPKLSMMAAALVVCLGLSGKAFNSRIYDQNKKYTESLNHMSSFISDQMSNIQQVKMLGLKGRSSKAFDARLLDYHYKLMNVYRLWGANGLVLETIGLGGLCFILAQGCLQISMGLMPPESIWYVLFCMYVGMGLRGIIMNLCKFFQIIQLS